VEPASFPMICEPQKWSTQNYGGYLNNKIVKSDLITGSSYHGHKTDNRENLFKAINYMSSVKFGFNEALLNYLENEGIFFLRIISLSLNVIEDIFN